MARREVEAAGGVVVRERDGRHEVVLVHRPRYDDWSLPKGKLERGESFEQAALREVAEETGVVCRLGAELEPSTYTDRKGRPKIVRWWLMVPAEGEGESFDPDEEVDELRWLTVDDAIGLADYEDDRRLLRELPLGG